MQVVPDKGKNMYKITKQSTKPWQYLGMFTVVSLIIFFSYDIILTNILGYYYCSKNPQPKTYISKKVDYPESIYWEDNVYPGFDKEDRALMILNYLDGSHLKTMALNGEDGKIYLYTLQSPLWQSFKKQHPTLKTQALNQAYVTEIAKSQKVYTKERMPRLNYTVTFNEIPFNGFVSHFLYSDETKIIENNSTKVIAYNRRIMRFYYKLQPDFAGGRYYWKNPLCGGMSDWLDRKVFGYFGQSGSSKHVLGDNRMLYEKYIKGGN